MGDIKFEQLIKKFSPKIKQLVSKVIINSRSIDKDDLFQEIVYHLWQRWRNGEFVDKTDAYIMGSCYFHLKNYLRRFGDKAKIVSLNEPVGEVGSNSISIKGSTLGELIPVISLFEQNVEDVLFIRQMKEKELTRQENEVAEFLSQDYTLREIGKKLNISHVRVLKIKENIKKKFKKQGYQRR